MRARRVWRGAHPPRNDGYTRFVRVARHHRGANSDQIVTGKGATRRTSRNRDEIEGDRVVGKPRSTVASDELDDRSALGRQRASGFDCPTGGSRERHPTGRRECRGERRGKRGDAYARLGRNRMIRQYAAGTWHSHSGLPNASVDRQEARPRTADQHLQRAKQHARGMGSSREHGGYHRVDCIAAREDLARHLRDVRARRTRRPSRHRYSPSLFLLVVTNDDVPSRAHQPCAAAEFLLAARGSDDSAQVLDLG